MPRRKIIKGRTGGFKRKLNQMLSKRQQKGVRAIARQVVRTSAEKKRFGFLAENEQLFHNKVLYSSGWLSCKQGTADDDSVTANRLVRIGDEFYLKNINVRFWLSNKNDRPNVMYKLFMFWYDSDATLSDALVFFTQQNKMLDRINNEQVSIIDQKTIFSGPSYATGVASDAGSAKEHSYLCTLNGNWKGKKITYDEGGSVPKKRNIGIAIVAYDTYGTLQTDNIASLAYNGMVTIAENA